MAQAEAQAPTTLETNLDPAAATPCCSVALPARGGELSSRRPASPAFSSRVHDLNPREHRTPIALPLDLRAGRRHFQRAARGNAGQPHGRAARRLRDPEGGWTFRILRSDGPTGTQQR